MIFEDFVNGAPIILSLGVVPSFKALVESDNKQSTPSLAFFDNYHIQRRPQGIVNLKIEVIKILPWGVLKININIWGSMVKPNKEISTSSGKNDEP